MTKIFNHFITSINPGIKVDVASPIFYMPYFYMLKVNIVVLEYVVESSFKLLHLCCILIK